MKKILLFGVLTVAIAASVFLLITKKECKRASQCSETQGCRDYKCIDIKLGNSKLVSIEEIDLIIKNNDINISAIGHDGITHIQTSNGDWYVVKGGVYNIFTKHGKEPKESLIE